MQKVPASCILTFVEAWAAMPLDKQFCQLVRVSVSQLYSLRVGTEVGYCEVRSGLLTLCGLRNNAHSRTKSNFICNPRRYMDGLIGKVGSFAPLRAPFLAAAELASLQ